MNIDAWRKEVERNAQTLENIFESQPKIQINVELDFRANIIEIQEFTKVITHLYIYFYLNFRWKNFFFFFRNLLFFLF
jgi:hypothetical protein